MAGVNPRCPHDLADGRGTIGRCPTDPPPWTRRGARSGPPCRPRRQGGPHGRLTFLGHSTVLIEIDDLRILTDPVLRQGFGPVRRQVGRCAARAVRGPRCRVHQPRAPRPPRPAVAAPDPGQADGHRARAGSAAWPRAGASGPVEEVEPGDRLTIDRVRAGGRVRRALREARAVRPDRARDRGRHPRARDRSTSPATRTCSRPWTSSAGTLDVGAPPGVGLGPDDRGGPHGPGPRRGGGGDPAAAASPSRSTGARSTPPGCDA